MGHRLILSLVLLCLSTFSVQARQPGPNTDITSSSTAPEDGKVEKVEELAEQAKAHYAGKRYSEAVATYLKAYHAAPAAAVLYNIAHIYDRKLNEGDLAADFYRRYISSPDADPTAVKKATNRLQELKAEKAARELKAQAVVVPPPVTVTPAAVSVVPPKKVIPKEPPSSALRTIGIITSVVGVGLITGGVVMGLKADQNLDSFKLSTDLAEKKGFRDDGETQALVADVLYGVGGAVLIGGVVMILLQPDTDTAFRIGPTADGHGATVLWGGAL